MESGKKQICSAFEDGKRRERKVMFVRSHRFLLSVSPPKSGHKRDVRCKGGSYVVHGGDKVSTAPLK